MEYGEFSSSAKIGENLNGIIEKQYRLTELRICELEALCADVLDFINEMKKNELAVYEIMPLVSEEVLSSERHTALPKMSLLENAERLAYAAHTTENLDKTALCQLLCERAMKFGMKIGEAELLQCLPMENSFVYVKNAYSDEAYDVLCEDIRDARVKYVGSFKEAAQEISEGAASYCILPLEEHSSRIASVSELIAAYDLKINAITPVFGFDGTADMKYAMFSRFCAVPERGAEDDGYLEIRHLSDSQIALSDIIFAASAYGHGIYRVNTYRITEDGEEKIYYSLVLRDGGADFSAMLVYLSLFSPDTVVVGMYKNLE